MLLAVAGKAAVRIRSPLVIIAMEPTLRIIRIFFFAICLAAGLLVGYVVPEWDEYRWVAGRLSRPRTQVSKMTPSLLLPRS